MLERVIALDPAHSQPLREEAGARLAELDDDAAAMDQYAALLASTPDSSVTQEKLFASWPSARTTSRATPRAWPRPRPARRR